MSLPDVNEKTNDDNTSNKSDVKTKAEQAEEGSDAAAAAATTTTSPATTTKTTTDSSVPSMVPSEAGSDEGAMMDEEEALFANLEKEHEKEIEEEAANPSSQPKDIKMAPKLLQKALEQGDVEKDESEDESEKNDDNDDNDNEKIQTKTTESTTIKTETEVTTTPKEEPSATTPAGGEVTPSSNDNQEPHYHQRANQLDFLLSRASEYSNFISRDLDELQANMTETARRKVERAEKKKGKKRKSSAAGGSKKKSKNNDGQEALKSAQAKDATVRAGSKPIFIQPSNLANNCFLKDYQLEGVRWLASLFENGVSGILADEMGLGKTIQVIGLIAHLLTENVSGPFLIVAPLATLPNWVREIEKWLPTQPVVRYHGPAPDREALLKGRLHPKQRKSSSFPVIVTSYEVAIRDQAKLEKLSEFTYLIVDEGHRLKNHRCTLLSSLKRLKAANRLLLTGTPIQNTLDELWSLLNFVNPQIFDDLSVFQSWFGFKDIGQKSRGGTDEAAILLEQRQNQTVSKLHEILRPFLLRRIKNDVLSEMPPKKEVIVYSGLSKLQAGYGQLIDNGTLRDTLLQQGIEQGRTLSQTNKLMNHRKNVNHPFLFGEPIDPMTGVHLGTSHPQLLVRASGKFALLDRMLSRLHQDGHQVLIFSQMTSVLNVMEDYLQFRRWKYCRIDGSTNIDDRQRQMDVFNAEKTAGENGTRNSSDSRYFVFLLSTRAGGLGINLTGADTCIIFDSDWNPHSDSQAMDRCHRMGQTLPVAVYRLLSVNSVDIEMMEKQISKKKLERMTIAGGDFRKGGRRSQGEMTFQALSSLLESDIKDLQAKGGDIEDIKIDDEEFDMIMDRKRLFASGSDIIPAEGKMYDVLDAASGDMLGAMNA